MSSDQAYVVVVTGRIMDGKKAKMLELFAPLAEHVTREEVAGALTYQLSWGEEDPDSLVLYERYISKEYFDTVHCTSAPFLKFFADMKEHDVNWEGGAPSIVKFVETGPGFHSR